MSSHANGSDRRTKRLRRLEQNQLRPSPTTEMGRKESIQPSTVTDAPQHEHPWDCCRFVASKDGLDLYVCRDSTYVVRFSPAPTDFIAWGVHERVKLHPSLAKLPYPVVPRKREAGVNFDSFYASGSWTISTTNTTDTIIWR